MRALKGKIPRAYPDHRRVQAKRYAEVVGAVFARLGTLPRDASSSLREYGRTSLELEDLAHEYEQARARRRLTMMRRIRREKSRLRITLLALERRLEEFAANNGHGQDLATRIQASLRREDDG